MPPKKQDNKPKKVAVDKVRLSPPLSPHPGPSLAHDAHLDPHTHLHQTFGMKNKNKSTKVQQQVKIIQQQEAQKGINKDVLAKKAEKDRINEKKKAEQAKRELEGGLYGGLDLIVQPKVPFGVGASSLSPSPPPFQHPPTHLAACSPCAQTPRPSSAHSTRSASAQRGASRRFPPSLSPLARPSSQSADPAPLTLRPPARSKCKFSHDLNADRKGAKASVYADQRDEKKQGPAEGSSASSPSSPPPLPPFPPRLTAGGRTPQRWRTGPRSSCARR